MPFSYRRLFFGGTTCCCCLPVRFGVLMMSSLGCLAAGILMILLWFELATTQYMTTQERVAFILAALTATVLFAASILGLVGAIVRKQLFIQIYAYILDVNFVLNLAIVGYFTYEVSRATNNAESLACQTAIQNPQAQSQCTGLLTFAKSVYLVIAGIVLLTELYCVIVATRYLNQLQREKGSARASRLDTERAFQLKPRNQHLYSQLHDIADHQMHPLDAEFDPYGEINPGSMPENVQDATEDDIQEHPPPTEEGYGGGSWSHDEIVKEEKERLRQRELGSESVFDDQGLHDEYPRQSPTKLV